MAKASGVVAKKKAVAKESALVAKNKAASTDATSTLHPPYFEMINDAISSLKERSGSSQQAIAKFIGEKHGRFLPPNYKKVLSVQLKKFVKTEKIVKVKNSFKICATAKAKKSVIVSAKKINKTTEKSTIKASISSPVKKMKKAGDKVRKMKRLSQVKTPEGLKNKTKVSTPTNKKTLKPAPKSQKLSN